MLALPINNTQTLILRLATTDDPLKLWALDLDLNKRVIAPTLRWPANLNTLQAQFITIVSDLHWLATQYPDHQPLFKAWRQLFKLTPDSDEWHSKAFWILKSMESSNLSRQGAKGLALGVNHRKELMMFQTPSMARGTP